MLHVFDVCHCLIGASLSEPHTSVTALCVYLCLDRPLTVNFKWAAHSNFLCPCPHVLQISRANEREVLLPDCRVSVKKSERRSIWMYWQHARQHTFWTMANLTIAWQGWLQVTDGQQYVRWLQVCAWHDRSYIAGISLLARGLTVKLSPCQCISWTNSCCVSIL